VAQSDKRHANRTVSRARVVREEQSITACMKEVYEVKHLKSNNGYKIKTGL